MISDGCAAADLCASGWRPCQATDLGEPGRAPRPRGSGRQPHLHRRDLRRRLQQAVGMSIVGCAPFDRTLGVGCTVNSTAGWDLHGGNERATVVHNDERGGVLCCKL
jgi:hypothetical protein